MEKAEENMEMLLKDVTERFETLAAQEAKKSCYPGAAIFRFNAMPSGCRKLLGMW